jgi:hypothetical protein
LSPASALAVLVVLSDAGLPPFIIEFSCAYGQCWPPRMSRGAFAEPRVRLSSCTGADAGAAPAAEPADGRHSTAAAQTAAAHACFARGCSAQWHPAAWPACLAGMHTRRNARPSVNSRKRLQCCMHSSAVTVMQTWLSMCQGTFRNGHCLW